MIIVDYTWHWYHVVIMCTSIVIFLAFMARDL